MAATVLGSSSGESGKACSICMASDHSNNECAVHLSDVGIRSALNLPNQVPPTPPAATYQGPSYSRPSYPRYCPYTTNRDPSLPKEICRRFNRGLCSLNPCKYDHTCSGCFMAGHPLTDCPSKGRQRYPPMTMPPGPQR